MWRHKRCLLFSMSANSVSANLKEKISAATEEVKETLGVGKQEYSEFSAKDGTDVKNGSKVISGEENQQKPGSSDTANTLFGKFKSSVSSVSPKVSVAFQKLKEAKPIELAKKGYDIVKDELSSNPNKRKRIEYGASSSTSSSTVERSTSTDVAVVPSKQSKWSKKLEAFKEKMQGHPIFKCMSGLSEPVVVKSQEFAEDIRDRWDTTDNPVVHKIQDLSETVFGETSTALSFKEIHRRDPSFSLPEFVAEVEEVIKPVLNAYFKFQTQQVYCVRDRNGSVTEGGKDTIHTVYYAWAMQQADVEELGEGALFPIWGLRELQRLGVKALI
ncbi:hypothetical protein ACSBR1_032750 [Camellia fascicularis]